MVLALYSPRLLGAADYIALVVYFSLNLGIGWWSARRRKGNANDFFLAGGRIAWWATAVSFFATGVSSISFMALPAYAYTKSWIGFGSGPAQVAATIVLGMVFVGILRRLDSPTIFSYLERRFSRGVRLVVAASAIMLKVFGRMSVVMLLPALALSTVTGLDKYVSILIMGVITTIYAMEGGFEAVVWTDVLQATVMFGGVFMELYYAIHGVPGGFREIISIGNSAQKFHMLSLAPTFNHPTVWVFVGMFIGSIFAQLSDQPLMQRAIAANSDRNARRTVIYGGILTLPTPFMFFFLGSALFAFYNVHPERLAAGISGDKIVPYFIVNELPAGMVGFIIASLFAAAMGALSSMQNAMAAIVVSDFLPPTMTLTNPQKVKIAKGVTVLAGVIAIGTAVWIAYLDVRSLWDQFLRLVALVGGGAAGVFGLGLLTRRANSIGVIAGTISSVIITWMVQTYTQVDSFAHTFVAVASCGIVGYIVSLFTKNSRTMEELKGLTIWDRRR